MALGAATLFEINSAATAGNLNGGGFNPGNANFITDYAATLATSAAPVITSATYTFVAEDVNAWLYVKSGTNWTAGFYKITAVNGGAATINAAVGAAVQVSGAYWRPSTVAGCATVASPTGGTIGIDYSQGTAALNTAADLACADGDLNPAVITSAGKPFSVKHVGNLVHITAGSGYTTGWYEIVSVSGSSATLDRAVGTDGAKSNGTFYLGGALSLGAADDDAVFEIAIAGNNYFVKSGTYTLGATVTVSAAGGTSIPIHIHGYSTVRGDRPLTTSRPTFDCGSAVLTLGTKWNIYNMQLLSTSTSQTIVLGTAGIATECKAVNVGNGGVALWLGTTAAAYRCEGIGYLGSGAGGNNQFNIESCYLHSSSNGVLHTGTATPVKIINCLIVGNYGYGIRFSSNVSGALVQNNTIYGGITPLGTAGIAFATGSTIAHVVNNNIYGYTAGITHADATQTIGYDAYNNIYNCTTARTNYAAGVGSIAVDPGFTGVSVVSGLTATTSGSVLTQAGGDFSTVVPGQDYLYLVSGTGVTAGYYRIVSILGTAITLERAPGTNATADKVFRIITGRNFKIGVNLQNVGMPAQFYGSNTVSYSDIGAAQARASGGSLHLGAPGFGL